MGQNEKCMHYVEQVLMTRHAGGHRPSANICSAESIVVSWEFRPRLSSVLILRGGRNMSFSVKAPDKRITFAFCLLKIS